MKYEIGPGAVSQEQYPYLSFYVLTGKLPYISPVTLNFVLYCLTEALLWTWWSSLVMMVNRCDHRVTSHTVWQFPTMHSVLIWQRSRGPTESQAKSYNNSQMVVSVQASVHKLCSHFSCVRMAHQISTLDHSIFTTTKAYVWVGCIGYIHVIGIYILVHFC